MAFGETKSPVSDFPETAHHDPLPDELAMAVQASIVEERGRLFLDKLFSGQGAQGLDVQVVARITSAYCQEAWTKGTVIYDLYRTLEAAYRWLAGMELSEKQLRSVFTELSGIVSAEFFTTRAGFDSTVAAYTNGNGKTELRSNQKRYEDIELTIGGVSLSAHNLQITKSGAMLLRVLPQLNGNPLTRNFAAETDYFRGLSRPTRRNAFSSGILSLRNAIKNPAGESILEGIREILPIPYVVKESFLIDGQQIEPTNPNLVEELIEQVRIKKTRVAPEARPSPPSWLAERVHRPIEGFTDLVAIELKPGDPLPAPDDLKLDEVAYYVYDEKAGEQMDPMNFNEWKVVTNSGVFDRFGDGWRSELGQSDYLLDD